MTSPFHNDKATQMRFLTGFAIAVLLAIDPSVNLAQVPADESLVFEVATIKPVDPSAGGQGGFTMNGRKFAITNLTLKELVAFAYELHGDQVAGGPSWLASDHYTIVAQPEGQLRPSSGQLQVMTQKLLAERFKLAFHHEQRELAAFVLTIGKNGSKLRKAEADATGLPNMGFRGLGRIVAKNTTMREFTGIMQFSVLDRPVLDHTNLLDKFDFELDA